MFADIQKFTAMRSELSMLSFIGGAGVEGGQGNSDCIFTTCDDHDTYGVLGSGDQGPGNGEPMGTLIDP
eukprot:CAMPEP_0180251682 /NCGR_PEP_ID=MMETSP0987-20121128/38570_1 /TAXON_ID=697907 /ORGANISM="non described non described, Strain CCMP2293" /LENGTH=68 /DNA_ID=CAMNT_0022220245 /DNA_START=20 /DNA_END=226 /DNA_ORIENTATION=-